MIATTITMAPITIPTTIGTVDDDDDEDEVGGLVDSVSLKFITTTTSSLHSPSVSVVSALTFRWCMYIHT